MCRVWFTDSSGVRHLAEVQAESMYEAAVEGVSMIASQWGEQPGLITPITVEVKAPAVQHQLTLKQIRQWLESTCHSPKEKVTKERLRQRLSG